MTDELLSRRVLLSAAAAAPAVPALLASDRIAIFSPPPERVRIATVAFALTPAEVRQIESQGKNVQLIVTESADHLNRLLPEVDVVFGAIAPEMLSRAKNLRWMQHTEAGMDTVLFAELVKSPVVVQCLWGMLGVGLSETAPGVVLALT